jgi:hypothetical protein
VNRETFVSTLSTLPSATFLLIPGDEGKAQLLHHGFLHASEIGGTSHAVFIHGNLSESPFKELPIEDIITPLSTPTPSRTRPDPFLRCPSLAAMCAVESAKAFADLPAENNEILHGRPNHFFISGLHFIAMNGQRTFSAAAFAFEIISLMLRLPDENDENQDKHGNDEDGSQEDEEDNDDDQLEQEKSLIRESRAHHEALLAYLWTIERSIAPPIRLTDPPDDPTLGGRTQEFRSALTPFTPRDRETTRVHPEPMRELDTFAVATQGLVNTLANIDKDRQEHRKEDQAEKSVLRNLGPAQRELFKRLCTTAYNVPGEYSPSMQHFTQEKSSIKATNQMAQKTREWTGTFSEPAFQRFLTSGYESQEKNASHPGGFTIFLCHPRSVDNGVLPLDKDKSRIRDLLGLDQSDAVVDYFTKKSYYVPSNADHLKIQIQTFHNLLQELTCPRSIALRGLRYILDHFDRNLTILADMFEVVPSFAAKFLYTIDRAMQFFFKAVQDAENVDHLSDHVKFFLYNKATDLMDGIQDSRAPIDIVLPACLRPSAKHSDVPSGGSDHSGNKRDPGPLENPSPSKSKKKPVLNDNTVPAWKIPAGKTYNDTFHGRSEI